jgi:hypothetical protein
VIRRRLAAVAAALIGPILALTIAAPVAASCSQAYVVLYKDATYSPAGLQVCYPTNIPNLSTYGYNDNVSSMIVNEGSISMTLCMHTEANYSVGAWKWMSDASPQWWVGPPNDMFSSLSWDTGPGGYCSP